MKWVFAFLLLLNIGYFMWGSWYMGAPGTPPALQPRSEVNAQKMQMLSDVDNEPKHRVSGTKQSPKALTDVTPPRLCYRVGPFSNKKSASDLRQWLAGFVLAAKVEQATEKDITYRVYIPPLASAKAVSAMRKRLTRLGFKDHAPLKERGLENAISLGVFNVKSNATNRLQALRKNNIKAKLQTIGRTRQVYWVHVKSDSDLMKTLQQPKWNNQRVTVVQQDCQSKPRE